MRLSFAFSPCPNDTFMFEPLVNNRINHDGFDFDITMDDVENLNKAALQNIPDITKLSFNAYTKLYDRYQLLTSGSALGRNCGPLLISKKEIRVSDIKNIRIAIPGYNTTAFFLLKYAFPEIDKTEEMIFSDIEKAVLNEKIDAGVIIHENRFTYQAKGLRKIMDLGEYWEQKTGFPIPLGGIAIKRSFPDYIKRKVNSLLKQSISYAFDHPEAGLDFTRKHAQEMDSKVIFSHIDLYVNEFSRELGNEGKKAVLALFKTVYPTYNESNFGQLFVE